MKAAIWSLASLLLGFSLAAITPTPPVMNAANRELVCWEVENVRAGMKGHGLTVLKGTKIERFEAEVLGVLMNTSPGRDLILCRLSGLELEKTGVIAGMSGSPIYLDGKLLGAVAYAWAYGKEPIAGVTPFAQMHRYVEAYEKRDLAERSAPSRIGLASPVRVGGQHYDSVTIAHTHDEPRTTAADGLWLVPLKTPLSATGFTPHSLALLRDQFEATGLVPMQGGAVTTRVAEETRALQLEPGGALSVALVMGDFDLSAIGTVTHIEDKRVYGWGHPFFGAGACEFPLMTGYVHAIYPRQTVSFKIGSPVRTVGVVTADVSTCIAGWLDRQPDLLPVRMTVTREQDGTAKTFDIRVVRQRALLASLVFTALTNSVDMEGELPEELTAELKARVEIEGYAPVVIDDVFSGASFSGGRAPQAIYGQVATVLNLLTYNTHRPVRIEKIECATRIRSGRMTAEIEAVELDSERYAPGETMRATVFVRPYKGSRQTQVLELKLPPDLPEGNYTATVCDDLLNARHELRDNPTLSDPRGFEQLFEALQVQTSAKRTNLVLRVPVSTTGVALDGKALPKLPGSMVQILSTTRRTGAQTLGSALAARQATPWVVQGSESVRFTVTKNKRVAGTP